MKTIGQLRIALIGVAHWHVPLYIKPLLDDKLNVVAVSDPNTQAAHRVARLFNCPSFEDATLLLDRVKPDFVFAFAPHNQMFALARELINRGIPFTMEKPVGLCAEEVDVIAQESEKKNVFCAIPFIWRYSQILKQLKADTASSEFLHLGFRFVAGPSSRYLESSPWMLFASSAGGGCMTNLGVHFIDAALYLTGSVDAHVEGSIYQYEKNHDIEIYGTSLLLLSSSATLSLETGYAYPVDSDSKRDNRWNFATTSGYFSFEDGVYRKRILGKTPENDQISGDSDDYYPVFVRETLNEYICGLPPTASIRDMLLVRRVLDEMNHAAQRIER